MLPSVSSSKWDDLLLGKNKEPIEFLGIKIALQHASILLKYNNSPSTFEEQKNKIRNLFIKYEKLSVVQNDIKKIFD